MSLSDLDGPQDITVRFSDSTVVVERGTYFDGLTRAKIIRATELAFGAQVRIEYRDDEPVVQVLREGRVIATGYLEVTTSPQTQRRERVARALHEAHPDTDGLLGWDEPGQSEQWRERMRVLADAAIAALTQDQS